MSVKSIHKSIRLSKDVYDYIMAAPGKGFNEKFEGIILEAWTAESIRKQTISELDLEISQKRRELLELFDSYKHLSRYFSMFRGMQREIDALNVELQACRKEKENQYESI